MLVFRDCRDLSVQRVRSNQQMLFALSCHYVGLCSIEAIRMNSQVILVLIFSSVRSCRGGYKIACVFSSMCDTHGHKTPKQSPHYKIKWLLMMALPPLCFVEVHRPCQASPSGMISATDTSPIIEAIFPSTGDTDEVDRLTPVAVFFFYSVVINTIFYMYFLYFSLT